MACKRFLRVKDVPAVREALRAFRASQAGRKDGRLRCRELTLAAVSWCI